MITGLVETKQESSLWVGYTLAAKVMQHDLSWLKRRFRVLSYFLRDSPVYQEVLEEGREEGKHIGELAAQRQTLRAIVLERFPALASLAKTQADLSDDPELLRWVTVKMSVAPTQQDVERLLLTINKSEQKN